MLKNATRNLLLFILAYGSCNGIESARNPFQDREFIYEQVYGTGDYLQYASFIDPNEIHLILEIGSRDAIDAVRLGYYYKCPVYAFECNPEALKLCAHNAKNYPYVTLVPFACWNEKKMIPFYPVVQSHGGSLPVNIGGSSLLVARKDGADAHHIQGQPIMVQAVRVDEWMDENKIKDVDLICMDCQGATLQVLKGMGDRIKKIKYIITEVYLAPSFEGEALYPEIRMWLEQQGFELAREPGGGAFCDLLFVNLKR